MEQSKVFDIQMIERVYANWKLRIKEIKKKAGHPLTFAEKILFVHLAEGEDFSSVKRGEDYLLFRPDRVAMQDATAQMALLQLMVTGKKKVSVPSSVHCDHLIIAEKNAAEDVAKAKEINKEVYDFLFSVAQKYGIDFWGPGAGIIHQVILENYAFPGGMMIGSDSHTVNAGGLGMMGIGVGGNDAMEVMAGFPWELKMPRVIGVHLTGRLNGWASAKDVILKLAGILTVKGATNAVLEYFGEGALSLSCTGKATICNMGAEVGATASVFGYDSTMKDYLHATGREIVAGMADALAEELRADDQVIRNPHQYYDQVIHIDLNTLEPYINGPFTPDAAFPISEFAKVVKEKGYPEELSAGLVGSCTNSSYEDLMRCVSILRDASDKNLSLRSEYLINPGSEMILQTLKDNGALTLFEQMGAKVMANACGPCIGQWKRNNPDPDKKNSIVTSFNRNFAKRNDGNPNTYAFVASPELVTAMAVAGKITYNPMKDSLVNAKGEEVKLNVPSSEALPAGGFKPNRGGYIPPAADGSKIQIIIKENSERLQVLKPFAPWNGKEFEKMPLLIKVKGKCTTDHISMAGQWLRYRGHLDKISDNLLMGAVNAFNGKTDHVKNLLTGEYGKVSAVARHYKESNIFSVVVAEDNYGEGSSREHAAMEPRYLNVAVIMAKSFARIHETNLKKQGLLAVTFEKKEDYDRIREDDRISIRGVTNFSPGQSLEVVLHHTDGTTESFRVTHTYNATQIEWFKAGSALNVLAGNNNK